MPEYVGERFYERQVVVAVSRERMSSTWDLVNRLLAIGNYIAAIAIVEHEWDQRCWSHDPAADNPAKLLNRVVSGPTARVEWDRLSPIDRSQFTDRWLRNLGCGMAYGPLSGPLSEERRAAIAPIHFTLAQDVLAMFSDDCEFRHSHVTDSAADSSMSWEPSTRATFDTCFVLRDATLTGVFIFGEED